MAAATRALRPRAQEGAALAAACGAEAYALFRRLQLGSGAAPALQGAASTVVRQAIFAKRCRDAAAQNAKRGALWSAAVNQFADRTQEELRRHLGHRPGGARRLGHVGTRVLSFLGIRRPAAGSAELPAAVDWRARLRTGQYVRHQGSCGSCWALAAVGALEMHAELAHGNATRLVPNELLQCMSNPRQCGGSGGCEGATAELAFAYAARHGVPAEQGPAGPEGPGACGPRAAGLRAVPRGFVQLAANRVEALLHAVATVGPAVVAVDASDWFPYHSGVFDGCGPDAVLNHAVLLVGYGSGGGAAAGGYWLIRNSWGQAWGEGGHIRVLRHAAEGAHCGVDRRPHEGFGCAGGPSEVQVCGMCGVLADSSYPVGVRLLAGEEAAPGPLAG